MTEFGAVPPSKAPDSPPVVPQERAGKYYSKLLGFYGFLGAGVFPLDPICGRVIVENAEETARAMDKLARENKSVARVVELLTKTGVLGQVVTAHIPILMVIMEHHAPNLSEKIADLFRQSLAMGMASPESNGGPVDASAV